MSVDGVARTDRLVCHTLLDAAAVPALRQVRKIIPLEAATDLHRRANLTRRQRDFPIRNQR